MEMKPLAVFAAVLIIIILSFSLASCKLNPKEDTPNIDYRTGNGGITTDFILGSISSKVYAGSPFSMPVEVKNTGAYDSDPDSLGWVYLHGFDSSAMPFEGADASANYVKKDLPAVRGKNAYLKEGGADYSLSFEIPENRLRVPYGDKYEPTLMLSTCYYYRTLAVPTVCIIPDPAILVRNSVCEPKTIVMTDQGAPVAVTKIEEEISKGTVNFIITIENVGGGVVINPDHLQESCPFNLDNYEKLNLVDISISLRNAQLMAPSSSKSGTSLTASCSPSNRVRLVNGKGTVFCRFALPTAETAAYTTPLNIQLDYGYNTNVQKTITIAQIPGTNINNQNGPINNEVIDGGGSGWVDEYGNDPY